MKTLIILTLYLLGRKNPWVRNHLPFFDRIESFVQSLSKKLAAVKNRLTW